ncbi:MAG: prolyl oligopeptidase family serine peptidase [Saprospiraceae bacterium]|nr:prolyl oligopeptidase family serine peptidase [Saprospiraceae bacterium]
MKENQFLFFLVLVLLGCSTSNKKWTQTQNPPHSLSSQETLDWVEKNIDKVLVKNEFKAPNGLVMPYRLFSPEITKNVKVPLVVFLHGRGDRGIDNDRRVYKNVGLFMNELSLVAPNMQHQYPCYVLVPQCSDKTVNEEWAKWVGNSPDTPFKGLGKDGSYSMSDEPSESGAAALALIEKIIQIPNIDRNRIYLIGLSMGGFGTWEFTARRPGLFAGAVPMAGFSDPTQIEKIKHIPFWIFHGDTDKSNPVEGSRTMYQLLKKAGADIKYTEYEGAGHGESFRMAFAEQELISWMFSKRKQK